MKKYSIVIVENDEDEQFFMKEGFDAAGLFEIKAQLRNGDELLEWLKENETLLPDLVLSDLNMPGKNGYDILDELKANPAYTHLPIIITSTSSAQTIIDKCRQKGAAEYMIKPDTFVEYEPFVVRLHGVVTSKQLVKT